MGYIKLHKTPGKMTGSSAILRYFGYDCKSVSGFGRKIYLKMLRENDM